LLQCADATDAARLSEDDRRFRYGEAMVEFYHHLVRTALLHRRQETELARHEFRKLAECAEKLLGMTDPVVPIENRPPGHADAKDGFEATQAEKAYNFFKQKYGN